MLIAEEGREVLSAERSEGNGAKRKRTILSASKSRFNGTGGSFTHLLTEMGIVMRNVLP